MHSFNLLKKSIISAARLGEVITNHGVFKTPVFMPIATRAAIKSLTTDEVKNLGAEIILSNTYHLMMRPGNELIRQAGSLHQFMDWSGPILTDSGGYQVFSLAKQRKILVDGVKFKSEIDGQEYYLTPKKVMEIQADLGSDIMMVLDECAPYPSEHKYLEESIKRNAIWAKKMKDEKKDNGQLLFGIVQGGIYDDLRKESAESLIKIGFDGYALGGLTIGEPIDNTYQIIELLNPVLPLDKPRYLMGAGRPEQIVEAVKRGIDMFDCVIPTREGRHGRLFLRNKNINLQDKNFYRAIQIANNEFSANFSPINPDSNLPELKKYTLAYLHHLFKTGEPLAQRLATLNNLEIYLNLIKEIREAIAQDNL